jgi:Ca2+-binding RTX toxin-like protein
MRDFAITGGNAIGGSGGAIGDSGSSLVLERMSLYGNHADVNGGAVSTRNFTMRDSIVRDNDADSGGGIYANALTYQFTVERSTIADNHAVLNGTGGQGGGIYVAHGTTTNNATIKDSTFDGNTADVSGGGLYRSFGNLTTIQNSAFTRNHAGSSTVVGYGGGVFFEGSGPVNAVVTNSTFAENTADRGAAIDLRKSANYSSAASFVNSTIADNSAIALDGLGAGGGIRIQTGATVTLNNTIVARNLADNAIYANIEGTTSGSNNLIGGDPRLTPLGFYGGFTETLVPLIGSPALNAGSNSAASSAGLTLDQRGLARVVNGTVDIGAAEFASPAIANGRIEVYGTASADTITITDSTLTYNGTAYNISTAISLVVYGQGGNDIIDASATSKAVRLYGEAGTDTLKGGSAADFLDGGTENDTIYGGSGNDTFAFAGTASLGTDSLFEFNNGGSDTLDFSALDFGTGVNVNLISSSILVNHNGKSLTVSLNNAHTEIENVIGTKYNDWFADTTAIGPATFAGGLGDDYYVFDRGTNSGGQILYGDNDAIIEKAGEGNDTFDFSGMMVFSFTGGVNVDISSATVQHVVSSPHDSFHLDLTRALEIENVIGTAQADTLTGNVQNNALEGRAGNDTYKFIGSPHQGSDTIFDQIGSGTDTIDFSGLTLPDGIDFDLRQNGNGNYQVVNNSTGQIVLNLTNAQLENVTGTRYDDTLIGNTLANSIKGGAGDDYIQGREGTDQLNGGTGNDIYNLITGQTTSTDVVTDVDGYTIQFPNGTTSSRPFIELSQEFKLLGRVGAVPGSPITIGTVSDIETATANLEIDVTGVDGSDITVTPAGDIVWSPDSDEIGSSYQITITVQDQAGLVNTVTITAAVVSSKDSDNDGLNDLDEVVEVGTDPFDIDTDGDQLPDGFEHASNVLDPLVPNDPQGDHDGDGLVNVLEVAAGTNPDLWDSNSNGQNDLDESDLDDDGLNHADETSIGTNPNLFDTDEDLLSDGFEVGSNLDPLDDDENANDQIDSEDDFDDDGLSNLDEQIHGTNATQTDTDGDGTSDQQEANQGSNPSDPGDEGQPPEQDDLVDLELNVGDDSGSHSERWELRVGQIRHQSPDFGVLSGWTHYQLEKGQTYDVTLHHRASNRTTPDHDWFADIRLRDGENSVIIVENPRFIAADGATLQLLGHTDAEQHENGGDNVNDAVGRRAFAHIPEVDLDITSPEVADESERNPGGMIRFNNDDDDGDLILDFQDPSVAGENDFVEITLRSMIPAALHNLPATLTVTFSNTVRVWRNANKTNEVISGETEFDMTMNHTLFVERVSADGTAIEIEATYTPDVEEIEYRNQALTVLGTETTDIVRLNANPVNGNLTAYRPMFGPGSYLPFPKTAVVEVDEASQTLGPGIRINGDDDNNNGVQDFSDNANVPGENDLIEMLVERTAGQNNLVLTRSSTDIAIWMSSTKSTPISFPNNGLQSAPLQFTGNQLTVFGEWTSATYGEADVQLIDMNTSTVIDAIKFHTFTSVIVVFGGNNQSPVDENGDGQISDPRNPENAADHEGMYAIAQQLYESGWDVHPYNEEESTAAADLPYKEVANAVSRRSAIGLALDVAILGYSHGGGATRNFSERLHDNNINVDFAAMIDAVDYWGTNQENDYPDGVDYLLNIFQENGGFELGGGPIENNSGRAQGDELESHNVTLDAGWDNSDDHYLIDDDTRVQGRIRSSLDYKINR